MACSILSRDVAQFNEVQDKSLPKATAARQPPGFRVWITSGFIKKDIPKWGGVVCAQDNLQNRLLRTKFAERVDIRT
jgi:hypothetical protein